MIGRAKRGTALIATGAGRTMFGMLFGSAKKRRELSA
jgi:hypothetical protein